MKLLLLTAILMIVADHAQSVDPEVCCPCSRNSTCRRCVCAIAVLKCTNCKAKNCMNVLGQTSKHTSFPIYPPHPPVSSKHALPPATCTNTPLSASFPYPAPPVTCTYTPFSASVPLPVPPVTYAPSLLPVIQVQPPIPVTKTPPLPVIQVQPPITVTTTPVSSPLSQSCTTPPSHPLRSAAKRPHRQRQSTVPSGPSSDNLVSATQKLRLKEEETRRVCKEKLQNMNEADKTKVLEELINLHPLLVAPHFETARPNELQPEFCACGKCVSLTSEPKESCCRKNPGPCVTDDPTFVDLCLRPDVLLVAGILNFGWRFGRKNVDTSFSKFRNCADRFFILWKHGILGPGVRVSLPNCALARIRCQFPEETGIYTGFQPGRDKTVLYVP